MKLLSLYSVRGRCTAARRSRSGRDSHKRMQKAEGVEFHIGESEEHLFKWQPTPVFLPGESRERRNLVGCCLWGRTESDMTEATWQQQQQQWHLGLPRWLRGKETACQCRKCSFHPWVGKIPWRRAWQLTSIFLPGEFMDREAWWATVHAVAKSRT